MAEWLSGWLLHRWIWWFYHMYERKRGKPYWRLGVVFCLYVARLQNKYTHSKRLNVSQGRGNLQGLSYILHNLSCDFQRSHYWWEKISSPSSMSSFHHLAMVDQIVERKSLSVTFLYFIFYFLFMFNVYMQSYGYGRHAPSTVPQTWTPSLKYLMPSQKTPHLLFHFCVVLPPFAAYLELWFRPPLFYLFILSVT